MLLLPRSTSSSESVPASSGFKTASTLSALLLSAAALSLKSTSASASDLTRSVPALVSSSTPYSEIESITTRTQSLVLGSTHPSLLNF